MHPRSTILLFLSALLGVLVSHSAAKNFPDTQNSNAFRQEARSLSRHFNLPVIHASDAFLGLMVGSSLVKGRDEAHRSITGLRGLVYPNPEYEMWGQFSIWDGDEPHYAISAGIQVEYPSSSQKWRRAIGLGWTETHASIHIQRDIQFYGLLGWSSTRFQAGTALGLNLHHMVVEDGHGIADYDETFQRLIPYIGVMIWPGHYLQLLAPMDSHGSILNLSYEIQFAGRN